MSANLAFVPANAGTHNHRRAVLSEVSTPVAFIDGPRRMGPRVQHGHALPERIDVGTMIEVPALLYQLDEILKKVDFVSVGSNDLFQFMFAVDRGNAKVSERFDTMSAPILRALRDIVRKANAAKKVASLCGEMASKPLGALALIALGYRSLSMSATGHGPVKALILDLDAKKAEAMIMPLLDAPSGSVSIREKLTAFAEAEGLSL